MDAFSEKEENKSVSEPKTDLLFGQKADFTKIILNHEQINENHFQDILQPND